MGRRRRKGKGDGGGEEEDREAGKEEVWGGSDREEQGRQE